MLSALILASLFGVPGLALLAGGRARGEAPRGMEHDRARRRRLDRRTARRLGALRAGQDTAFFLWQVSVTAAHAR